MSREGTVPSPSLLINSQTKKPVISDRQKNGADDRIRTGDLFLTKEVLYLLSYISASFGRHVI